MVESSQPEHQSTAKYLVDAITLQKETQYAIELKNVEVVQLDPKTCTS